VPRTVILAPDSFKGSLPAHQVAEAIAAGWRDVHPDDDLVLLPQADGGEGTLDAIASAVPGAVLRDAGPVTGPDGRPTPGAWLQLPDGGAVVELAQCSGLPLMAALDPLGATTRGLGEVIAAALDAGATALTVGLGGSASTDVAAGALAALGLRLLDADGRALPDGGAALARLHAIDTTALRTPPPVTLLTDVTAPLLGAHGAAAVFGPQKGADPQQVAELDAALTHAATILGGDPDAAGAGAAGGAGYGFAAVWGASIVPGADRIAELTGLPVALETADVLLTGEGRFDVQSLGGKVVGRLLQRADRAGVIAGVIAGQVELTDGPWTASLTGLAGSVDAAIADPARWLRQAGAAAATALG
jgi:glycerate kinase